MATLDSVLPVVSKTGILSKAIGFLRFALKLFNVRQLRELTSCLLTNNLKTIKMGSEKLSEYKKRLEGRRAELLKELKKNEVREDFGSDTDHYDEEADEAEEFSNQLALSQEYKDELEGVNNALNKIISGDFGSCERCAEKIEAGILNVAPASRFCKKCKAADK